MIERYAFAVVAVLAAAIAHPVCNAFFRCGCGALTFTSHCNIHALAGPQCPWCVASWRFALVGAAWIAGSAAGLALSRRIAGRRAATTLVGGVLGLAVGMLVSGAVTVALT